MVKLGKTSTFTDNHCWSNHAKFLNLTFLLVKSTTVSSCWWNQSLLLVNFTFLPLKSQVFMVQSWFLLLQSPFLLLQSFKKAAFWGEVVAYFLRAKRPPKERRSQDWSQENTKNWLGVPKITKIIGFWWLNRKLWWQNIQNWEMRVERGFLIMNKIGPIFPVYCLPNFRQQQRKMPNIWIE